jgi:tetratricopeptide (TPR) repeat protein
MPEARHNLALCLAALNRPAEARTELEQAIRVKPDYAEAHADLGRLAFAEKRYPDAIASFERVCQLKPDDAEMWMHLAEAYWAEKKYPDGSRAAERAAVLSPKRPAPYNFLARAYLVPPADGKEILDGLEKSEMYSRKAIELCPEFADAHLHLADSLRSQGKFQEALDSYRRVLVLVPGHPGALGGAASMLEVLGRFDEASEVLAPAVESGIRTIAVALPYAALSRHTGETESAVALLEGLLADSSGERPLRMEGHFMLGKLYDSEKKYEQAFRHYRAANELKPKTFDQWESDLSFDAIITTYDRSRHQRRSRATNRSRLPVFIVGMPRSGTTLTEQILASHPLVHGAGELVHIGKINGHLPELTGVPWPDCMDRLNRKMLDEIAQRHLDELGRMAAGKARVTDKMPHNFRWLGLIDLLFPEARIIHCQRDPMDNCLSIYCLSFGTSHAYANNLEHLGAYYRQYERLMAHWRRVVRVPILDMAYEDTVADLEQSARKLIEFCGLEWDEQCLRFHELGRAINTHSYDQVRQPIYKKSVARWKRYENFLEPLKRSLGYTAPAGEGAGSPMIKKSNS